VGVGVAAGLAVAVAVGIVVTLGVGLGLAGVVHADRRSATARSQIFIASILIFVYVIRYTKLLC